MLATALPANVSTSTNSFTGLPQIQTDATSVQANDSSAPGGMALSVSATPDSNPANFQANPPLSEAALISVSSSDTLAGGTALPAFTDAKGAVFFENGNFGDPQVESDTGAISTVSVYNPQTGAQIVLSDVTTVRYRGGTAAAGEAVYGVGYVGNATQTMPGGGTVTYRAFWEGGQSAYDDGSGLAQMFVMGDATLTADLDAGTVTGGVDNASLNGSDPLGGNVVNLNPNIDRLAVDATITGNTYAGTAVFRDASGAALGTQNSEVIGGFFGPDADNTAAAIQSSGRMELGGQQADYILQGVLGGAR